VCVYGFALARETEKVRDSGKERVVCVCVKERERENVSECL
jgi:hypothetical protein